jgi:hypothetical protein
MNVTPELVRAEMAYRMERAQDIAHAVAPRRSRRGRGRRGWFGRGREPAAGRRTAINGAPRTA